MESFGPGDGSHWDGWHGGCGGDKERDVQSTAAVLNEIGVGGLSVEVATDNEAALKSFVERGLAASSARGYHWRNISEARPPGKRHRESRLHQERRDLCQLVGT